MSELKLYPVELTWTTTGTTLVYAESEKEAARLAEGEDRDDYEVFSCEPDLYVGKPITPERVREQDPELAQQQVILPDGGNCDLAEIEARIEDARQALWDAENTPGTPEYLAAREREGQQRLPLEGAP